MSECIICIANCHIDKLNQELALAMELVSDLCDVIFNSIPSHTYQGSALALRFLVSSESPFQKLLQSGNMLQLARLA